MKRFATEKHEAIAAIPPVVRVVPVRVELALARTAIHVEQMRVAVRVILYIMPSVPPPLDNSRG